KEKPIKTTSHIIRGTSISHCHHAVHKLNNKARKHFNSSCHKNRHYSNAPATQTGNTVIIIFAPSNSTETYDQGQGKRLKSTPRSPQGRGDVQANESSPIHKERKRSRGEMLIEHSDSYTRISPPSKPPLLPTPLNQDKPSTFLKKKKPLVTETLHQQIQDNSQ
ncbi:hypothetical protein TSAR_000878, partial [Trichomalopsis sarcophagae]